MTVIVGNMWDEIGVADALFVTTNAVVWYGCLVMGRGAAQEARDRFPGLAEDFGRILTQYGVAGRKYGVILSRLRAVKNGKETRLGAFQTKLDWRDSSPLELVRFSTHRLKLHATSRSFERFVLNFPGISNGRLTEAEVLPIISSLPDNVFVYKKPA